MSKTCRNISLINRLACLLVRTTFFSSRISDYFSSFLSFSRNKIHTRKNTMGSLFCTASVKEKKNHRSNQIKEFRFFCFSCHLKCLLQLKQRCARCIDMLKRTNRILDDNRTRCERNTQKPFKQCLNCYQCNRFNLWKSQTVCVYQSLSHSFDASVCRICWWICFKSLPIQFGRAKERTNDRNQAIALNHFMQLAKHHYSSIRFVVLSIWTIELHWLYCNK